MVCCPAKSVQPASQESAAIVRAVGYHSDCSRFRGRLSDSTLLPIERIFYLTVPLKALLLGSAIVTWLLLGYWLELYDRLDSAHPSVVMRDTFRQCVLGSIVLILLEFLLRLDLSRAFLLLFAFYSWFFLCLFRWRAGSLVGLIRREFGAAHYVMVVGLGDSAMRIARLLEQSEPYGVRLAGLFADDAASVPLSLFN